MNGGELAGVYLAGVVIGLIIGSLIGAIFLRWATRIAAGFTPRFRNAFYVVLAGALASWLAGFILGMYFGVIGQRPSWQGLALSMAIGALLQLMIYAKFIRDPSGRPIGYGKAFLGTLLMLLMAGALTAVIYLVGYAVWNA